MGVFSLAFLPNTNTVWRLHSLHFHTHKYQEPVQGEFLPLHKSFNYFYLLSLLLFFTQSPFLLGPLNFYSSSFYLQPFLLHG